ALFNGQKYWVRLTIEYGPYPSTPTMPMDTNAEPSASTSKSNNNNEQQSKKRKRGGKPRKRPHKAIR
uniref:Uncharacterized protein n=1 Tax=Meloidogyne javanica TaxID=6303 RepID=A0A915M6F0_MELJA